MTYDDKIYDYKDGKCVATWSSMNRYRLKQWSTGRLILQRLYTKDGVIVREFRWEDMETVDEWTSDREE